jgi:hypothetical protein
LRNRQAVYPTFCRLGDASAFLFIFGARWVRAALVPHVTGFAWWRFFLIPDSRPLLVETAA